MKKKSKTGEDGSYCTAHVGLVEGIVDVGVIFVPQTHSENYAYRSNLMF